MGKKKSLVGYMIRDWELSWQGYLTFTAFHPTIGKKRDKHFHSKRVRITIEEL